MTQTDRLRQQQHRLRIKRDALHAELLTVECELIRVDRHLGEYNNLNQPGSGRDISGIP